MKHVTYSMIESPERDVLAHLEECPRCRSLVDVDVDLRGVRTRILQEALNDPFTPGDTGRRPSAWRGRPGAVVALSAAAVVLLIAPVAWLGLRANVGDTVGGAETSTSDAPVVGLPEAPPEPSPQDAAPPVPIGSGGVPSFEMAFTVGDVAVGRLIWQSPTFYEGLRANLTEQRATFDYGWYRANADWGFSDPDNSTVIGDEEVDPGPQLPQDEIPWQLLVERLSDEEMWSEITGATPVATPVEPTNPEAGRAWASKGFRLEVTDDGIPVLIERPGVERFEVTDLTQREIRVGEIGNNTDLPFAYALFLSLDTTDEQHAVLADGIVTFADYQRAAEAAARCAGVRATFDEATGMFTFPEAPEVGGCVETFLSDIAAVWRVDSQWLDSDEFSVVWAMVEGLPDAAEMYRSERGPERALASGDGWAISISDRGPGYCTRVREPSGFGDGCFVPAQMQLPGVMTIGMMIASENEQWTSGSIIGVVVEQVDRIVIRFTNGAEQDVVPGDIVELGLRGYGAIFDASDLGVPTEIEAFSDDVSLGVFTTDVPTDGPWPYSGG